MCIPSEVGFQIIMDNKPVFSGRLLNTTNLQRACQDNLRSHPMLFPYPNQDLNDVDPEMAHATIGEHGNYPCFSVVHGEDREKPLSGVHPVIVDRTIRGCTSAS